MSFHVHSSPHEEVKKHHLPVPFAVQRAAFMEALPEKKYNSHKEAENRNPPKDPEKMMESLLTFHLNSKFEDGDDAQEDSTTAFSAHTDCPSKRRRGEDDDRTPDHDNKRRNCDNCNKDGHDWYMCTQKGGALEHISYSNRMQYFENCRTRRQKAATPSAPLPPGRTRKEASEMTTDAATTSAMAGLEILSRSKTSSLSSVRSSHSYSSKCLPSSQALPSPWLGGEEEDDEPGDEECHMAKRATSTTFSTITTIIDNQSATDVDIDTSAALSVGGASCTGATAPTTTEPPAPIATTATDDEGATGINGHADATDTPTDLSVGNAPNVPTTAQNWPSNNEHSTCIYTGDVLHTYMAGVVEHIEENYILPISTVLLLPYFSAFGFMRSRNQHRSDSLTTTDPYTGEQLPKPILTTCTFDCDCTSYPITPKCAVQLHQCSQEQGGAYTCHPKER
jgi:hypothetical protein